LAPHTLGFEPALEFAGPIDALVPTHVAGHMLAVLREALSNVASHAGATHVDMTLRADSNLLREVVDDGRGGVSKKSHRGKNGLRNVKRRAEELGGTAYAISGEDGGTRSQWVVPLTSEAPRP